MDPTELVLRDLVDAVLQEDLFGAAGAVRECTKVELARRERATRGAHTADSRGAYAGLADGELWLAIPVAGGLLVFRGRDGGALQRYRLSRGPVWHTRDGVLAPDEVLRALTGPHGGHTDDVAADLRLAAEHAAVTLSGWQHIGGHVPARDGLLAGERLAATRNRPFHPTARAATGWSASDLERHGPMTPDAVGMDWVAVRRECLRHGSDPASGRLERVVLDAGERERLAAAMASAGVDDFEYQPLPVHPWQFEHVLEADFAEELAAADVVPVARDLGRFHPTSSLRTLISAPHPDRHLKLPLGVATLGAARLLPPRYLDNGERAQRTLEQIIARDATLAERVVVCDERVWCGWRGDDEFADRPGQLAAQVRSYPYGFAEDGLVLPMAALAADDWDALHPALADAGFDAGDPVALFSTLAEAFCDVVLGFLRHGVLPEVHGQNVVVALAGGQVRRFALRDHDTVRLEATWMAKAGVADPGYRIKPGGRQSLLVPGPDELLGYAQTLGFQVNLYGIADALSRHHGIAEHVLWEELRRSVVAAMDRAALPDHVAEVCERELLRAPEWPSRHVLGPLLAAGRSSGVSMPAAGGRVPNPLRATTAVMRS